MDFSLKIITDSEVDSLIERPDFLLSWSQLAKKDRKVTVIQEPPFVITWYKQYKNKYTPVLCLGYNKTGELVGLMPLAKSLDNDSIVHAGAHQAEYHGWVSDPEVDEDFPVACLIGIKRRFNPKIWKWRWLPPQTPINWFSSKSLSQEGIFVKYRRQASPLWDLRDLEKLRQVQKNKSIKSKLNRYKKKGEFYLERVCDKARTQELMPILKEQCDLRQEAIHSVRPFTNDSNKAKFYIEAQNYPEANHFTVLWSNNKPIAFHFGPCDDQGVYWGLSSYDPLEGKNSPGTLLIIELAKKMREEGFQYLDLTPGGTNIKSVLPILARCYTCQPSFFQKKLSYGPTYPKEFGALANTY
ncbi:MAG: GNAT family N-acetyltransferase [bacterium]